MYKYLFIYFKDKRYLCLHMISQYINVSFYIHGDKRYDINFDVPVPKWLSFTQAAPGQVHVETT